MGERAMRDAGRTVDELGVADELPGTDDVYTFVPDPDGRPEAVRLLAHARRVRRRNLWIWYWPTDTEVQVVDLTDEPPVPFG
jgi:hypothetical protein